MYALKQIAIIGPGIKFLNLNFVSFETRSCRMAHTCFIQCQSFLKRFVPPYLGTIIINEVDPNTGTIDSYARRQMSSRRVKDET